MDSTISAALLWYNIFINYAFPFLIDRENAKILARAAERAGDWVKFLNQKVSLKHVVFSLLIGLGAGLGAFFPVLLLLMPAFLGFIGAAWGTVCFVYGAAASAAALLFLVGDAATALYMLAAFLPASILLSFVLHGKRPYRYAVIMMSVVFALFGYAVLCLPSMLAGGGPFDGAIATISKELDSLVPLLPQLFDTAEQVEFAESYLTAAVDLVPEIVVVLIFGISEFFAFIDTMLARVLLKRAKVEARPMAPFILWQLPKDFIWGAIILGVGAVAVLLLDLNNANTIAVAVECIVIPPLALMGLAFFEFSMLLSARRSNGWRVFAYIALVLLFPTSLVILAGFGVLDRVMKVRSRMVRRK